MFLGTIDALKKLGVNSTNVDVQKEAFLCTTFSCLIQISKDLALKAMKVWGEKESKPLVKSAFPFLKKKCLMGAEGVTHKNCHCSDFIRAYMPNYDPPVPYGC